METKLNISKSSVSVNRFVIPQPYILEIKVDIKIGFPDMAVVLIEKVENIIPLLPLYAPLEIKQIGNQQGVFKGEISGLDLLYMGGRNGRVLIRAVNKSSGRR